MLMHRFHYFPLSLSLYPLSITIDAFSFIITPLSQPQKYMHTYKNNVYKYIKETVHIDAQSDAASFT